MNADRCPNIMESVSVRWDLEDPTFKMDAVVVANGPFIVLTEDLVQRLSCPWNKGRPFLRGEAAKFNIEGRTIDRVHIPVGLFHAGDPHEG